MPEKSRLKPPTEERLTKSALHYLDRYATSAANLRAVLERRVLKACRGLDLDPEDFAGMIDAVLEKCLRAGLVDDRAFAEMKAASLRRRGGSQRTIEAKLTAKGVDRETIRTALTNDEHTDDEAALVFARRRRLGPFRKPETRQARREKDLAAMCRAGFSFSLAQKVIDAEDDSQDDSGQTRTPDDLP